MMRLPLVCRGRCRLGPCSKVNINTVSFLYIDIGLDAPAVCISCFLPNGHGAAYNMLIMHSSLS